MIAWRTKPWKRRLITRCIGIIPSLAVAVSVGRQGIDALLVGSQVALSIVLTFVMIPYVRPQEFPLQPQPGCMLTSSLCAA